MEQYSEVWDNFINLVGKEGLSKLASTQKEAAEKRRNAHEFYDVYRDLMSNIHTDLTRTNVTLFSPTELKDISQRLEATFGLFGFAASILQEDTKVSKEDKLSIAQINGEIAPLMSEIGFYLNKIAGFTGMAGVDRVPPEAVQDYVNGVSENLEEFIDLVNNIINTLSPEPPATEDIEVPDFPDFVDPEESEDVSLLETQLQNAIQKEDYEEAAKLRELIQNQ